MSQCIGTIITSTSADVRDRSLDAICGPASVEALLRECEALDRFRRNSTNLYEKVRALFFLYAIHRFHLQEKAADAQHVLILNAGHGNLLNRRFDQAVDIFLADQTPTAPLRRSPARSPPHTRHWRFRLWPIRCGRACGRCAAINGCSAPGIRPIIL